jgi:hypothetical protein
VQRSLLRELPGGGADEKLAGYFDRSCWVSLRDDRRVVEGGKRAVIPVNNIFKAGEEGRTWPMGENGGQDAQ